MEDYQTLNHTKWDCKYHVVFIPKYQADCRTAHFHLTVKIGLAPPMIRALATLAIDRGVRQFRGEVLAENDRMRHLLGEVGAHIREVEGSTLIFDVPLEGPPEALAHEREHPLRRLLRGAAESLGISGAPAGG